MVNQHFGTQVPISARLHMVFVETMNFPNRDQVDQLKKWQRSFDQMCPALPENELLENGSVHCGHSITYYTFFILRHTLYKCTLSWKIVPIIVVTINGEGLHCTHNADQLALTCKVSRITYSG